MVAPSSSDAADGAEAAAPPASIEGVTLAVDGAVAAARHPDRALLMVAPPPGPAANRWLGSYKGSILLYAGEGRGGASADGNMYAVDEVEAGAGAGDEANGLRRETREKRGMRS